MSQRARSPVLGYNHNLRHGGRVFHVQTEDSGTAYAHLYTHLFYEGTILASKKMEYDPQAPEDAVRSLMQKQHKAMMKELSRAEHDPRIAAFFASRGQPARLDDPAPNAPAAPDPSTAVPVEIVPTQGTVPLVLSAEPPVAAAPAESARPQTPAPRVMAKPVVVVKPGPLKRPPVVLSSSADGVVVRRNVVVNVGGGAPPVNGQAVAASGTAAAAGMPSASGTPGPVGTPRPRPVPSVSTNGDGMFVGSGPARHAANQSRVPVPQPLASSREIRMPWETPAPARAAVPVLPSEQPIAAGSREVRMPWEAGGPPVPTDSFAADLVNDKGLDEVILEYLSDDTDNS
jgi:hypothetical protein